MKKNTVKSTFLFTDILIIVSVAIVGTALFFMESGWRELGIVIVACALFIIPFCRHGYKIEGKSGTFRMVEFPVTREAEEDVLAFLDGQTDDLVLPNRIEGGALVTVYYKNDHSLQFAQYYDYSQHLQGVEFPLVEISTEQFEILQRTR